MTKREYTISILSKIIDVAEEMALFNKSLTQNTENRKKLNKFVKMCENAKVRLPLIKHDELLFSIYNNVTHGKEPLYTLCPSLVLHKATKHFDTDKGFKEFMALDKVAKEEDIKKEKELREKQEMIEKVKKEGKDLQFVFKDGKMQQVIVDKKEN